MTAGGRALLLCQRGPGTLEITELGRQGTQLLCGLPLPIFPSREPRQMPEQDSFPTRQYSYGGRQRAAFALAETGSAPGAVYRFLLGKDGQPQLLDPGRVKAQLHDPFA